MWCGGNKELLEQDEGSAATETQLAAPYLDCPGPRRGLDYPGQRRGLDDPRVKKGLNDPGQRGGGGGTQAREEPRPRDLHLVPAGKQDSLLGWEGVGCRVGGALWRTDLIRTGDHPDSERTTWHQRRGREDEVGVPVIPMG